MWNPYPNEEQVVIEEAASVALERRPIQVPVALMDDDEMRRMYRIAESLALSGMFKDVKRAEQAFAKMVIGRDLGMSPAQSMLGLHLVEGNVQVHYAMLGRFVESRADEGYSYRAGWLKEGATEDESEKQRVSVWMDEDDPADEREVVGAFVQFRIHDKVVGMSRFTLEDAQKANLIKQGLDARAAWNTARRNMFLARAMSNGVKWFVPEVMGGLPIYAEGEIVPDRSVTAPVGAGGDEGTGIDLGPKVDATIARAQALGHKGLSNRGALELALGNRSPAVVNQWLRDAKAVLDRIEQERQGEPPDAETVPEDPPGPATDVGLDATTRTLLETRLARLEESRGEEQDPEIRAQLDEEIEFVRGQLEKES